MINPKSSLAALFDAPANSGQVVWIGIRPARREPIIPVQSVIAEAGKGLAGDRYRTNANGPRQVTLIQAEHLTAIASYLNTDTITPEVMRRNLVVKGINLLALKGKLFRIGTAVLEHSGECHPCSRMEESLGPGGYNAVRGHGGITARVVEGGIIALFNSVAVES